MRLFHYLLGRKSLPNSFPFRGKNRKAKPVTKDDYWKLKTDFEIEEKNMFYLRHAYLTPEQSAGHAKALNLPQKRLMGLLCRKRNFYDNVSIESRLAHLRCNEVWD
ncbi:hypothetical protein PPYR_02822 [Photinus pyralis]|uniref:Uncharacterized protein n=1 Tax=Photinus pyralis TaxID=7054 RepID=A0A1Y1LLD9_PHOPY|nr:uncharacterized protein LOC116162317 [Photinus pyralis]KAB0791022.1 hypothetical protein PPYR_02822 [Photinus pyralis]